MDGSVSKLARLVSCWWRLLAWRPMVLLRRSGWEDTIACARCGSQLVAWQITISIRALQMPHCRNAACSTRPGHRSSVLFGAAEVACLRTPDFDLPIPRPAHSRAFAAQSSSSPSEASSCYPIIHTAPFGSPPSAAQALLNSVPARSVLAPPGVHVPTSATGATVRLGRCEGVLEGAGPPPPPPRPSDDTRQDSRRRRRRRRPAVDGARPRKNRPPRPEWREKSPGSRRPSARKSAGLGAAGCLWFLRVPLGAAMCTYAYPSQLEMMQHQFGSSFQQVSRRGGAGQVAAPAAGDVWSSAL